MRRKAGWELAKPRKRPTAGRAGPHGVTSRRSERRQVRQELKRER